jgi:hypothetical protein
MSRPARDTRSFVEGIRHKYGSLRRKNLFNSELVRHHNGTLQQALLHWQQESTPDDLTADSLPGTVPFFDLWYDVLGEIAEMVVKGPEAERLNHWKDTVGKALYHWRREYMGLLSGTVAESQLQRPLRDALYICASSGLDDRGLSQWGPGA